MQNPFYADILGDVSDRTKTRLMGVISQPATRKMLERRLEKGAVTIELTDWQITLHTKNDLEVVQDLLQIHTGSVQTTV